MAECQSKHAQRAARADLFATASRLEQAKLPEAALKSYTSIFSEEEDLSFAREQWKLVLGLREGLKGEALDKLAVKYLDKADLYDEALGLYMRAIDEGHSELIEGLKRIQERQAEALIIASRTLFDNAQWVAAETYLTKALANVPNHLTALQLLGELKARKPSQENKEAQAAFEVGMLYLRQGRQASATDYFAKALEKQPDYEEAQQALAQALDPGRSLRVRYGTLLDNAMAWLAVELFRQQTDRKVHSTGVLQFEKARYHVIYGAHLLSYYERMPSFFGQRSEADLREAVRVCPSWWQPYKQMGNLYFVRGLNEPEEHSARRMFATSAVWFKTALEQSNFQSDGTPTGFNDSILRMRVQIDRLVSELLACPPVAELPKLWREIQTIESQLRQGKDTLLLIGLRKEFELVYYSLAIWYAVIDYRLEKTGKTSGSPNPPLARHLARFYLTCSLFCEPGRIWEAELNAILMRLFVDDTRAELLHQIEIKEFDQPNPGSSHQDTWEDVCKMLEKVFPGFPNILSKEV